VDGGDNYGMDINYYLKYYQLLLIGLFIIPFNLISQNLVRDGGFEDYTRCPLSLSGQPSDLKLKNWYTSNKGTTDYFNSCCKKEQSVSTPYNQVGNQVPRNGDGYIGLVCKKMGNYSEYIQTEFTNTMINNEEYYIEFWVSLAESSTYAKEGLGAFISEKIINENSSSVLNFRPQIIEKEAISDTSEWVKISGTYRAKGNEKYIIIGNFNKGSKYFIKTEFNIFPFTNGAYYFIDDVLVEAVKKEIVETKQFTSELNKSIILKNITFELGKSILLESSFAELDQLSMELNTNTDYQIVLSGYTDNIGKEEDNMKLSEARAKAVADYLIQQGITKNKISYVGYGSTKPIADNTTEQGREQNRRVEFMIKTKDN
jgi:outer membrane protein OmpA-like peptidoglycan-associated protein